MVWSFDQQDGFHQLESADDSNPRFSQIVPANSGTFSHTFDDVGEFAYRDVLAPSLSGRIIVQGAPTIALCFSFSDS